MSVILSAFSAIFAYVLALLDGKGGLAGWSCEYLITLYVIKESVTHATRDLHY